MMKNKLTIGSRGSDLALWQANHIKDLLERTHRDLAVDILVIATTGDKILDSPLSQIGSKGLFTKEIEQALLDRQIDLAVHSLKDLPTELPPGLALAAVPERASVEDVFLSPKRGQTLLELPDQATLATGSLRRSSQLLHWRKDLEIVDIRGNVPTRIRKMLDAGWDGMVLASAGVERLGLLDHVSHKIPVEMVIPAVGQGALGIETREDDSRTRDLLAPLNDGAVQAAVAAERALLRTMGGGCQVPIGAYARVVDGKLDLMACVCHPDGLSIVRGERAGQASEAEAIGEELAKSLLENGAKEILEHVYRLQSGKGSVSPGT